MMIIYIDDLTGFTVDAYRSKKFPDMVIIKENVPFLESVSFLLKENEYESMYAVRLEQIPYVD